MLFTESLMDFLTRRLNNKEKFYTSYWLESLEIKELEALRRKASIGYCESGEEEYEASGQDISHVISIALSAETKGRRRIKSEQALCHLIDKINLFIDLILAAKRRTQKLEQPLALSSTIHLSLHSNRPSSRLVRFRKGIKAAFDQMGKYGICELAARREVGSMQTNL